MPTQGGGGGGGVLRIASDRRIFWGLKFSSPGFFRIGKFGKYFFGGLDLSSDCFWVLLAQAKSLSLHNFRFIPNFSFSTVFLKEPSTGLDEAKQWTNDLNVNLQRQKSLIYEIKCK